MQKTVCSILLIAPIVLALSSCKFPQEPDRFIHRPSIMKLIPGGTFLMGTDDSIKDAGAQPVHQVTLDSFYMDSIEVTQALYYDYMLYNPSSLASLYYPVESVSWFDAVLFCNARSKREHFHLDTIYSYSAAHFRVTETGALSCSLLTNLTYDLSKAGYRLPTEAEWEYACRAGSRTEDYWGSAYQQDTVDMYAWFGYNSTRVPQKPGIKTPNKWGLYDMIGNVTEWCNDWYKAPYSPGAVVNPAGPEAPITVDSTYTGRVFRGGAYDENPTTDGLARSATRRFASPETYAPKYGFRCVLKRKY